MFLRFLNLFMIWTGSEHELLDFMSDFNKKHPWIKFEFKHSITKIEFVSSLQRRSSIRAPEVAER